METEKTKAPLSSARMIIVGAAWYGDWAKSFYRSCLRLGVRADIVYNNSAPSPLGGGSEAVTSFFERSKRFAKSVLGPRTFRFLKLVRRRISEYELILRVGKVPEGETVIIVFTWTPGTIWVLRRLKKIKGVQLALWLGESPTREAWWETTYPYFDHLYMVDEGLWMDELPPDARRRTKLFPLSSDDEIFHPTSTHTGAYTADISFVGQYAQSRGETLARLADHDLKIYGFGWEKGFDQFPYLRKCYHGPLPTLALNDVYNETKVIVGTLGSPTDPHTTATMRTFDIALAGGFQISQDVALTKKIFGRSIPTYKNDDEFVELVKYYLAHEDERRTLAAESYAAARNQSYICRAREILRDSGFDA